MIKRILSILLALVVLIGYLPVTFAVEAETVQSFSDMPDNWATPALKSAIENGLLYGYDGKIMPDSPLTRAQMAAVITRAFGAVEEGDISSYSDVKETDWFASSIAKAYKMGIMQGYAGKMDPNSNITREQVFVILARALKLKPSDTINKTFLDINEISDWAKGEVYAMVNAGYVKGSNGKLNPKANITRAEFAQVMYNIIKQYIRAAGEYTEVTDGNIMVNVPGVTLKNVKINGDLIVGDGVDDGDLVLDNVTVKGRLIVRGGGVNSIIIIGGSVEGEVIIAKVDGNIRVSVEDDADVEVIVIDDGKDNVIVEGTVGTVVVNIPDVPVVIQNATVNNIEVNCEGAADITVAEDAEVEYVVIGDKAKGSSLNVKGSITNVETSAPETKISGTGKVATVDVNKGADNTSVTTPDSEINNKGASGVTAGGGKEVPENESVTNNSDGSDIVTSPTVTPTPVTPPRVTPTPVTPPSSDDSPSYYPVSDISVDSEIMVLKVRETGTIAVTVKPSYATNKRVNWSSDNEDVATVANGVVTAKNPGIATITVTSAADSSKKAMVRLIIGDLVVPANGSIQEAINEATEGQVIAVTPGTYEEQLIIDKPLTLLGPNAMIAGGDKRYPEAIIKGTENGLSQLLELDAENVEINGFTFDNTRIDNYNNTTGTNTNLIEGIAILNNRFVNISGTAIYLRDGRNAPGVYSKDVKICNNIIEEISPVGTADYDAGTGILVMGAEDLIISGNIISKAAYNGIQLGRNNNATITDNIVTESAQPALQIAQWNAGEHEIRGNTFSTKSEEKGAIRLYGFKNGYDPEFIITDNIIENSVYGIQIGHGDAGKNYNDIRDAKYSLSNNIFNNISDKELIIYLNEKASAEDIKAMNALFEEIYGEGYGAKLTTKEDPFVYIAGTISWADYADTSWYNDTDTEFTIDTATQLAGLAELVNSGNDFRGKTVNLGADIDLLNIEWIPIGTKDNPFRGKFNGAGMEISNLRIVAPEASNVGLFGYVTGGSLTHLKINSVNIIAREAAGALVGNVRGLSEPIADIEGSYINIQSTHWAGGLIGYSYASVKDCSVYEANITVTYDTTKNDNGDKAGGITGYQGEGNFYYDNCRTSNVEVIGVRDVGGLVGASQLNVYYINCHVEDSVIKTDKSSFEHDQPYAGGIIGRAAGRITLHGCTATGVIVSSYRDGFAGELVGGPASNVTIAKILNSTQRKAYETIQNAIDAAQEGDTILIAAGTYEAEQIIISKRLTLKGAGDQSIIKATTSKALVSLNADGITLKDLKFVGAEGSEKGAGIKIGSTVAIDGLTIDNCIIEGFTNGIYADTNSDVEPIVKNVYIANTHFISNTLKGIYVEKLSESTIENCYFEGNGHFHDFAGAGIDINAKYADYNDITIRGCTFVNNGIGTQHGGGILVKARGTGDDTSYSSNPATLVNVKIEDCTFENNPKAIVLGEAEKNNTGPTNVVITNATYIGDGEEVVDYRKKVIPPQDITIVSANDSGIVDSEAYKGVVATFVLGGADLGKVQSVKVELFDDDDNLLAVTTLKSHKFPLSAGNLTAPIVAIEGSYEYGSWNKTEWTEGNPSPHNPPSYVVMTLTDDNGLKYRAEERNLHTVYSGGKTWSKLWPAGDTSITGISVAGVAATVDTEDKTVYYVELPFGTELSELKAEDIVVTTADPNATVADAITEDGGATWKVVVTAEDGITKEIYTIKVTVKKPNWGELADTSWYNDSQTFFTINTAEQLAGLAKLVNDGYNFSGKTIKLGEDIDLADLPWIPIGTGNSAFKGNFDGNNKKISNLYINSNAYINRGISHNGLFGNSQAGKIENVTLENVKIIINTPDDTNYSYTGSLAGLAQFVDNVTVTGSINIEVTGGARYIGGIVGHLYNGAMTNCKLNSTDGYGLISGKYDVGGLAGYVYYGTSITDSTVQNMKINGYLGVGGVSGRIQSENKNAEFLLKDINIENIILGKLYEGTESACVGGILGYPYLGITITIKDSHLEDVKIESSHAYNGLFYGLYSNTEQHGKVILENVSYSGGEFNYLRNIVGLQKGEIAKYYSSIQAAIDEATAGDNIIKVYPGDHGTSPIVIDQKEGVNITLEAVGEVVLKNQILFYGSTRHAGEETLTIRGFTFDFSDATADTEIISAPDRLPNGSYSYAHNISIENNTFRGSLDADVVAIKTTRVFGLEIRNCEGINLHSLGQIRAQSKYLKVSDCTITNAEGGINYYGPIDAEITGLTVYGADTEYGIRAGQSSGTVSGSVLTVSDSDIEAKYPVWLRGDAPETVIITGTKLNVNAEDGQKVKNDAGSTVTIDGAYYVTTEAELRDALSKDANRIVLGDDITLTKHVNLDKHDSLELDGDGHTITVEYDATNRCGFYLASDNITIKNVTITGDQRVVGIDTKHGTKGFTIENVTFKNISIGFYANPSVEGTIQNCHFEGLGIGIGYGSDASLEITDNSFEDINKYLEIFAELSDDEINEIIENNDFDYPVKIAEQSEPVSKIVIKDEGEESEE